VSGRAVARLVTCTLMPSWITARPRLVACALIGLVAYLLLEPAQLPQVTRSLIAWNIGAGLYIATALHMMFSSSESNVRSRALAQDEGQWLILGLIVLSAVACLAAVVIELRDAKTMAGALRYRHIAHAVLTILSSWFFTQLMFAQHYATCTTRPLKAASRAGCIFQRRHSPTTQIFFTWPA